MVGLYRNLDRHVYTPCIHDEAVLQTKDCGKVELEIGSTKDTRKCRILNSSTSQNTKGIGGRMMKCLYERGECMYPRECPDCSEEEE